MISLAKDQQLLTDAEWAVETGGDFMEDELVTVYRISDPQQQAAWYAQYINLGTSPQ